MIPYYEEGSIKIYNDDVFSVLNELKQKFKLIIIDPPYVDLLKEDWDKEDILSPLMVQKIKGLCERDTSVYVFGGIGEKSQSAITHYLLFKNYFYFKDFITWKKQSAIGQKKGWLYTREEILWFLNNKDEFVWNEKEQYSKERRVIDNYKGKNIKSEYKRITNVWDDILEVDMFASEESKKKIRKLIKHPSPKPLGLMRRIISLHTKPGDSVLEVFMGSGPAVRVCKELNRNVVGIDFNKDYCDMVIELLKTQKANLF